MEIRPIQPDAQVTAAQPAQAAAQRQSQAPLKVEAVERAARVSLDPRRDPRADTDSRPHRAAAGSDVFSQIEKVADTYVYRLVNRNTGEVVREFPPKDLVERLGNLRKLADERLDEDA